MLERLWQDNEAVLRSLVATVVVDASFVDDVLQESYTRLLRKERTRRSSSETYQLIRKVVWTTAVDFYRRRRRKKETFHTICLFDGPPTPLTLLIQSDERELRILIREEIRRAIEELTPEQQEAIRCYYGPGARPIKDACLDMGLSYSTLRSRMLAGVKCIRRRLRRKGVYKPYRELKGWARSAGGGRGG